MGVVTWLEGHLWLGRAFPFFPMIPGSRERYGLAKGTALTQINAATK